MSIIEIKFQIIQSLINNNNIEKAYVEFETLINELELTQNENLSYVYYEYALLLFETYSYEKCLITFNNAYKLNYRKKEIKDFIFNSFVIPNLTEFKTAYESNLNQYNSTHMNISEYPYENLLLDFIPISDNKYYIYDKELDQFNGFIDFSEENISDKENFKFNDDFSDILIIDDWNLNNIKAIINNAKDKIIYYLSASPLKTMSFLKIPTILHNYLDNVVLFESKDNLSEFFRKNKNTSLPHIILAGNNYSSKEYKSKVEDLINQEHNYRLSSKGRSSSNVLLTIGIPTWNRGHRALESITELLKLKYDSEIEFLVSNNGSKKTTAYYDEIEKLSYSDSRINYFKFELNQGFFENICNVLEIASGKFVLLLSDEDMVDNKILPQFMTTLKNNPTIGVLRSGCTNFYSNLNNTYIKAGDDSIKSFFLSNNYLTGIIYNTEIIKKYNLIDLLKNNRDNSSCAVYPHMWLDSAILAYGDLCIKADTLCIEGAPELQLEIDDVSENIPAKSRIVESNELDGLRACYFYESRLEQHISWIDLINKLPINDPITSLSLYLQLCSKTNFLVSLVKNKYLQAGYDWNKIYDEIYDCCIEGIYKLNVDLNEEIIDIIKENIKNFNTSFR